MAASSVLRLQPSAAKIERGALQGRVARRHVFNSFLVRLPVARVPARPLPCKRIGYINEFFYLNPRPSKTKGPNPTERRPVVCLRPRTILPLLRGIRRVGNKLCKYLGVENNLLDGSKILSHQCGRHRTPWSFQHHGASEDGGLPWRTESDVFDVSTLLRLTVFGKQTFFRSCASTTPPDLRTSAAAATCRVGRQGTTRKTPSADSLEEMQNDKAEKP